MPASVTAASPSVVFPKVLSSAYTLVRSYTRVINEYPDGSSERRAIEAISRKRWALTAPLPAAAKASLKAFYLARRGGPFWFYELSETTPAWTVDLSGANANGRYAARFDSAFQDVSRLGARWDVSLDIIEIA